MGVVASRALLSTVEESTSRQGLLGMMPADLAARSMAPESINSSGKREICHIAPDKH